MNYFLINRIYCLALVCTGYMICACETTTDSNSEADSSEVSGGFFDPAQDLPDGFDYTGTYTGTLPCADCSGIRTVISLTDSTYVKRTAYLGGNTPDLYEVSGGASWDLKSRILTLGGIAPPNRYLVGENTLTQLDRKGNRVNGVLAEEYILLKRQQR